MMKCRMIISLAAVTFVIAAILQGCEKEFNYIKQHPDEAAKICRVQKLKITLNGGYKEVSFSYNAAGNPSDMITTQISNPADFGLDYHFRYDKHNRLTDYYYNGSWTTAVFVWHRYSYPDRHTIVDSQFNYVGFITDTEPPHTSFDYYTYRDDLDESGRVIKNSLFYGPAYPNPFVTNYKYDVHGNLVLPGVAYDNKVNVYQTNRVWSFIALDYSVNNPLDIYVGYAIPIKINGYNPLGLPLKLSNQGSSSPANLFYYPYDEMEIVYSCDEDKLPGKY